MKAALSFIAKHWPPVPGPDQPETGHMTVTIGPNTPVSLTRLHVPAWWTGVRLSSAARIRLITHEVTLFSECCPAKTWVPFAWPMPAQIATDLGMVLEIETSTPIITVCVAFHEMPDIDIGRGKRVCFVAEEGADTSILEWSMDSCKSNERLYITPLKGLKEDCTAG